MKFEVDASFVAAGAAVYVLHRIYVHVTKSYFADTHRGDAHENCRRACSTGHEQMKLSPEAIKLGTNELTETQQQEQAAEPAAEPEAELGPATAARPHSDRKLLLKPYAICLPLLLAGLYHLPALSGPKSLVDNERAHILEPVGSRSGQADLHAGLDVIPDDGTQESKTADGLQSDVLELALGSEQPERGLRRDIREPLSSYDSTQEGILDDLETWEALDMEELERLSTLDDIIEPYIIDQGMEEESNDYYGGEGNEQTGSELDDLMFRMASIENIANREEVEAGKHIGKGPNESSTPWNGELLRVKLTRQKVVEKEVDGVLSEYRSAYYGVVRIGSPLNEYTFVFDTGSGHLIVPSSYCHSQSCLLHKRFKKSESSTAFDIEGDGTLVPPSTPRDTMTVEFGTGEISGVFVDDIVCTETSPTPEPYVELPPGCTRMRIIAATSLSADPFDAFTFDGIAGLGMASLAHSPEFNFVYAFSKQMNMPQTFGIFLAHGSGESSELVLGGWDEERTDSDPAWVPVAHADLGHWMVKIKNLRVDDSNVDFCHDDCYAVVDSGTALMAVPSKAFMEMYRMLWHPSSLDGGCDGDGPSLHFDFEGDTNFTVSIGPPEYARAQRYRKQGPLNYGPTISDNKTVRSDMFCRPLLMTLDMPSPIPPKLFIIGEPALRKYYTVYDADAERVGFARSRHDHEAQAAPETATGGEEDVDQDDWFFG